MAGPIDGGSCLKIGLPVSVLAVLLDVGAAPGQRPARPRRILRGVSPRTEAQTDQIVGKWPDPNSGIYEVRLRRA